MVPKSDQKNYFGKHTSNGCNPADEWIPADAVTRVETAEIQLD